MCTAHKWFDNLNIYVGCPHWRVYSPRRGVDNRPSLFCSQGDSRPLLRFHTWPDCLQEVRATVWQFQRLFLTTFFNFHSERQDCKFWAQIKLSKKGKEYFWPKLIWANLAKEGLPIKCPPTKCVALTSRFNSAGVWFLKKVVQIYLI